MTTEPTTTDGVITEHHVAVQRTARYHTLGGVDGVAPAVNELWIVCHGYGQLAAPFLEAFRPIAAHRRLIVAPEALSRFYLDRTSSAAAPPPRVGASWMTREDRDHEIGDQLAYLDLLTDHVRVRFGLGPVRLRVLGFSQGVATVGRWVARGRTAVDEMILWAGAFPPDVELSALAARLAGAGVVLAIGRRDDLASWAGAEAQRQRFVDAGIRARLVTFDGGHCLDAATLTALADAP